MYKLLYTKQAKKDAKKLSESDLKKRAQEILKVLEEDPFKEYPPYEKLIGDLTGTFLRRINILHRIVYQVYQKEQIVKVIRMWTHYK